MKVNVEIDRTAAEAPIFRVAVETASSPISTRHCHN